MQLASLLAPDLAEPIAAPGGCASVDIAEHCRIAGVDEDLVRRTARSS